MEGCLDSALQGIGIISQQCCPGDEDQVDQDSPRSSDREVEVRLLLT